MDPTNATQPVPPELIADVQGNPPPVPPAADPGGKTQPVGDAGISERVERAAIAAVDQHLSESKRRHGQRGPDKRPRRPRNLSAFPLEGMGNGTGSPPVAESAPVPLEVDFQVPDPSFDEKAAKACIEIAIGLLNDGAAAVVEAVAKRETGDGSLAKEAGQAVRMAEKVEAAIRVGALGCIKKYSVRLDYANEIMLGGGLVLWCGSVGMAIKTLKAKGKEQREQPQPQQAAA